MVPAIAPQRMTRIAEVDERFQSYNIEMVEVTGGRFWKPYPERGRAAPAQRASPAEAGSGVPAGMDSSLYRWRPPIDLTNRRLRTLAAALGPAYVRVSGTWANSTFFADAQPVPEAPPAGFGGVLTREQWRGVADFGRAVNARIIVSFATSTGTRDASGAWRPDQAERLLEFSRTIGADIVAAEFMNEPNLAAMGGAPPGYDARAFARDFVRFREFLRQRAPELKVLGPGSVGETAASEGDPGYGTNGTLRTRELLAAGAREVDVFSYHHYGAVSRRCGDRRPPYDALSEQWLRRTDEALAYYRGLRDQFAPGRPLWLTETAEAACGGNPWASSFLDTFRYLDQLGRLAAQHVQVVAHNTLAASDYGLLDDQDLHPRPNYWAAILWRKLMGARVLDPGLPARPGLHVYGHCLRGTSGGVALLAINHDPVTAAALDLPHTAQRYTLSAQPLASESVLLNGQRLSLRDDDALPPLTPVASPAGTVTFAPATITFLAFPGAKNGHCSIGEMHDAQQGQAAVRENRPPADAGR